MIWQNPWAWIGLAAVAVPILVHLLGRRRPKPLRFPTLRFLDATRIVPARRHRLNDIPLLLVRIGILVAAVAALAQPVMTNVARARSADATARAVVVDASASMDRVTPSGRRGVDAARDLAQTMTTGATIARVIEATDAAAGIATATAWLAAQPGRRELAVVSDFQTGTIDRARLARVPADIGIALHPIDVAPQEATALPPASWGPHAMRASVQLSSDSTRVTWEPAGGATTSELPASLQIGVRSEDRDAVDRAIAAARLEGVPAARDGRAITIVFPGSAGHSAMAARVHALDQPWMFDVVERIRRDPTIESFARQARATVDAGAPESAASIVVADSGRALVSAAADGAGATARLTIFAASAPDDALSAALIARVWREAGASGPATGELELRSVDRDTLRSWGREPGAVPAAPDAGAGRSHGRWLWAVVLLLLALETWMRRAAQPAAPIKKEVAHARVA